MNSNPVDIKPAADAQGWTVLAILGPSGVGKSLAAEAIALARACSWLQVDDLRLALQASRATLPQHTGQLYFFERTPAIWDQPVDVLREAIIDVARLMVPAVRVVIDSHVATNVPIVIEGDGIVPELAIDPVLREHVRDERVRFCCVVPDSANEYLENMVARGRGIDQTHSDHRIRQGEMNAAYSQWLVAECTRCAVPVVRSRPFATLPQRIISAVESS